MLEDSEHLARQVIFRNPITMIERGLRSPTNIEIGFDVVLRPVHDAFEFLPVIHFFKRQLLDGRTSDDETVELFDP